MKGKKTVVTYRDYKGAFLLKEALQGNTMTYAIGCISSDERAKDETLSILRILDRMKILVTNPKINFEEIKISEQISIYLGFEFLICI